MYCYKIIFAEIDAETKIKPMQYAYDEKCRLKLRSAWTMMKSQIHILSKEE